MVSKTMNKTLIHRETFKPLMKRLNLSYQVRRKMCNLPIDIMKMAMIKSLVIMTKSSFRPLLRNEIFQIKVDMLHQNKSYEI